MKGLLLLATMAFFASTASAQRVVRKGTRPIQLTPKGSGTETPKVKKQFFTLDQLQGKWQEQQRISIASGNPVDFTDTLLLNIQNDKAEVREGMSLNMKGDAAIENGDDLFLAGDNYSVRSVAEGKIILDDGEFLRTMGSVQLFYLETVGKDSIHQVGYKEPHTILPANVFGKWLVYRREAKPGMINSTTELVKSISIEKATAGNSSRGEIVIYSKDISEKLDCFITLKGDNMEVVTKNKSWNFKTYMADNNEFIFGKAEEVMHFAKREAAKVNSE